MHFAGRLDAAIRDNASMLCVGLDPDPAAGGAATAERECLELIEATAEYCSVFKPNIAFFEQFGSAGLAVLERVRSRIPTTHIALVDAKRGDIGNSAAAYARGLFDVVGADAVTINPLMGGDAVAPFLERPDRGAFIITRTSNPGAADIMEQPLADGRPVYARIVDLAMGWNTHHNVGLVTGATAPEVIRVVRASAPRMPLLIPGIGTQGGSLEAAAAAGIDGNARGLVINVSRAIASAPNRATAARDYRDRLAAAVEDARQPR